MSVSVKGSILITGTSTGIGRACAILLDKRGYRVFAGVRREEDADSLQKEASDRLIPVTFDITDIHQIAAARQIIENSAGRPQGLSALINNAGIVLPGPLEFLPLDHLRREIEVNVIGQIAVTQAFLPLLRKGRGRIINISSPNGQFAFPFIGGYSASKFALEGATDALRRELRPWRIPVSIIEPGTVETALWDRAKTATAATWAGLPLRARQLYDEESTRMMDLMFTKGRACAYRAELLADLLLTVLEAKRPKARYRRGPGATMANIGRYLPARLTDWVVANTIQKRLPSKLLGW
jgi:NAD(P)-dependent dehydrogenase (short-subunit alcohol dehydrogenase family)